MLYEIGFTCETVSLIHIRKNRIFSKFINLKNYENKQNFQSYKSYLTCEYSISIESGDLKNHLSTNYLFKSLVS